MKTQPAMKIIAAMDVDVDVLPTLVRVCVSANVIESQDDAIVAIEYLFGELELGAVRNSRENRFNVGSGCEVDWIVW